MKRILWSGKPAHVWLNEMPDWTYETIDIGKRHCSTTARHARGEQKLALEMMLPGPKAHYGALGAVFVLNDTQQITVEAAISNNQGDKVAESLVARIDIVRKGFPEEYATGFLDRIVHFEPLQNLGGGTLSFCCALHGEIGSSIRFFQAIGRVIITLLTHHLSTLSDEELKEVIQESMRWWYIH